MQVGSVGAAKQSVPIGVPPQVRSDSPVKNVAADLSVL